VNAITRGVLHLIPVGLASDNAHSVLPPSTLATIAALDYFIVENEKSARQFLKSVNHPKSMRELQIVRFDKDGDADHAKHLLAPLPNGRSAGVLSEAGCPAIADPGALLVDAAHRLHLRVVPHVGPSSLLLALMAAGFNGQRFAFHGYLPVEKPMCRTEIEKLELESRARNLTQIFIETPYRSDAMLQALLETCANDTQLCVASDLTLATETIRSAPVAEWKKTKNPIGRRPSVFLIFAG
jgi:16S rRNA (cytidine1402-2'-O)-methyltransferase